MTENVNYEYLSSYVRSLPRWQSLRVLDYGCGSGEAVLLMREQGIDAVGCDVFYEGGNEDFRATESSEFIRRIDDKSDLPFADGEFDVILANMVFEHIDDFPPVLQRLDRVLRKDGHILLHFPTKEVVREGHIGLPFVHWFAKGSKLRSLVALTLRRAGLGYFKEDLTPAQWTRKQLEWIDLYCFYKPYREVRHLFDPLFTVTHNEAQYIRYRGAHKPLVRALLKVPGGGWLLSRLFRRLAFIAVVLRKRAAA